MSRRTSIVKSFVTLLKTIDGTGSFNSNLYSNVIPKLKFWDEVNDFPHICVVAGTELREYLPGDFKWGFLNISLKVYTKGEDCEQLLEELLEDIEAVIDSTLGVIEYDEDNQYETTEISITSITTDEGLLAPYGVGELNLLVRYQVM